MQPVRNLTFVTLTPGEPQPEYAPRSDPPPGAGVRVSCSPDEVLRGSGC